LTYPYQISYLITDLSTGGTPLALLRLLSRIDRNHFVPSVICFYYSDNYVSNEIMDLDIPVVNLGMTHKGRIDGFLKLNKALQSTRPVILHSFLYHANITGRIFSRFKRIPINITSRRSTNIGGTWREKVMRLTARMNDRVIAVSEAVRIAEIDSSGISPDKVVTIYNGIDPSTYNTTPEEVRAKIRNSFGIPEDVLLLGSIGRLDPAKGYNHLINTMKSLILKTSSVNLLIVGEGELEEPLEEQVHHNELSKEIKFAGLRNDIPEILSACDIIISSSLWEGLPNVVLEAMAAGKPVIATSVGGTPELVVNGETGLLVPPGNPEALENAILYLSDNSELQVCMGQAGRERVLNHFTIDQMVNKTEQLYQELMIEKGLL
jgi:glycosyltransferase involved in cell wall biosynthesis